MSDPTTQRVEEIRARLAAAQPWPVHVEDDDSFPPVGGSGRFRLVTQEAYAARRVSGSSARTKYEATVYSRRYADAMRMAGPDLSFLLTALDAANAGIAERTRERDEIREERERYVAALEAIAPDGRMFSLTLGEDQPGAHVPMYGQVSLVSPPIISVDPEGNDRTFAGARDVSVWTYDEDVQHEAEMMTIGYLVDDEWLINHDEALEEERDTWKARAEAAEAALAEEREAHAETASRLDRVLEEQVSIETYLVDIGIEAPDSMTPAGTEMPDRILGMVQDLHDAQSRDVVAQKVRAERAEDTIGERNEEIRRLVARVDRAVEMFGAERERAENAEAHELSSTRRAEAAEAALAEEREAHDAAKRALAEAVRERDARPEISIKDAAIWTAHPDTIDFSTTEPVEAALRVNDALRAHAAKEPSR